MRIPNQKRETPAPITETKLRRRGKEIQGFRTVQEGKRRIITVYFQIFQQESAKTESNQKVSEDSSQISE